MKMLAAVKLSEHKYETPEGYLICKDSIIARTGSQTYLASEIYEDGADEYIEIDRSEKEVFDPKTIASFEGKPLTIEHPSESVNPSNFKNLAVGNVTNVRKGDFEGQPVMYADIVVWDQEAIDLIKSGEMVELSCGYDCDITEGSHPEQINIRGNHVALCEQGRAGIAHIQDSKKKKDWGIKPLNDSVSKGTLIQEFGKQGKQYKIDKINGNVIYALEINTDKLVLFKKDEENIEWAIITKSEVRDSKIKDSTYGSYDLLKGKEAEEFERYLRDRGLYFEPSENGKYIHFEVKNADEFVTQRAQDIRKHNREIKDSFVPLYAISLEEGSWLDENDKPTKDQSKAKRFKTYQEADVHQKTYCKGKVCKLKDLFVEDEFDPKMEISNIENLLKDIPHGKIEESWGSLTVNFEERKDMRKAGKILARLYDIELFDEEDCYISIYDKFKEEHDVEIIEDSYSRKFYSKAIDALEEKLDKLEKNELLDTNQKDYENQKNKMRNTLKSQIEIYKEKLNED